MQRGGDFRDVRLEQAAGVRVRQHHRGDVRPELLAHRVHRNGPIRASLDAAHREAELSGGRRVRAMRRFGDEHLAPRRALAARLDRRADRDHAAQLAMRAGLGRQRRRLHARQFKKPARKLHHQRERALHGFLRLQWMDVREARQPRHLLVQARIVLHGAGAEREDAGVDGIVFLRKAHIVPDRVGLGQAGKAYGVLALASAKPRFRFFGRLEIDAARFRAADLENQRLLDLQRAIARESVGVARGLRRSKRKGFRHLNHEEPH